MDTQGNFIRINDEWRASLGYNKTEVEGKNFFKYVLSEDLKESHDAFSRVSEAHPKFSILIRNVGKDGAFKFFEWRGQLKGNFIFASARDVTTSIGENKKFERLTSTLEDFLKMSAQTIDYQRIVDTLLFLSDARYVAFLQDMSPREGYRLTSIAGPFNKENILINRLIKKFERIILPVEKMKLCGKPDQMITVYSNFKEFFSTVGKIHSFSYAIMRMDVGEVVFSKILKDGLNFGYLVMMMPKGVPFSQHGFISVYTAVSAF